MLQLVELSLKKTEQEWRLAAQAKEDPSLSEFEDKDIGEVLGVIYYTHSIFIVKIRSSV